jgi:hypothetical protein
MTTFTISDNDLDQIKDKVVVITGVPVQFTIISRLLISPRRLLRHRPCNSSPHPRPRRQSLCLGRKPPPLARSLLGPFHESRRPGLETAAPIVPTLAFSYNQLSIDHP